MLTIIPILNEAATPLEQTLCLTVIGRDPNTGDSASSHHCKKAALEEEDCKKTKTYWNARMIELVELFARTADSSPSDAFPLKGDDREVQFLGRSKVVFKGTAGVQKSLKKGDCRDCKRPRTKLPDRQRSVLPKHFDNDKLARQV